MRMTCKTCKQFCSRAHPILLPSCSLPAERAHSAPGAALCKASTARAGATADSGRPTRAQPRAPWLPFRGTAAKRPFDGACCPRATCAVAVSILHRVRHEPQASRPPQSKRNTLVSRVLHEELVTLTHRSSRRVSRPSRGTLAGAAARAAKSRHSLLSRRTPAQGEEEKEEVEEAHPLPANTAENILTRSPTQSAARSTPPTQLPAVMSCPAGEPRALTRPARARLVPRLRPRARAGRGSGTQIKMQKTRPKLHATPASGARATAH
jgi:hypothetical protein